MAQEGSSPLRFSSSPERQQEDSLRNDVKQENPHFPNDEFGTNVVSQPQADDDFDKLNTSGAMDVEGDEGEDALLSGMRSSAHRHSMPFQRSDIALRTTQGRSEAGSLSQANWLTTAGSEMTIIWGTNININETRKKFLKFLELFRSSTAAENTAAAEMASNDHPAKYLHILQEMSESGDRLLNIDASDICSFDSELYNQLVCYPQEIIPLMDVMVNEVFQALFPERADELAASRLQVRPYNLRDVRHMRDLNPTDIDKMVSIRGMVTRLSHIIPDIKQGFFRCALCHHSVSVNIDRGRIDEPNRCDSCGSQRSMVLIHNRCLYTDKQLIKFQETPESIPEGETPHTVNLCTFDQLVDSVRPGDRLDVTGIFRAVPMRVNPRQRTLKPIYKTYIDVIHFKRTGLRLETEAEEQAKDGAYDEDKIVNITPEDEQQLKDLAKSNDIYEQLTAAIAPSIWQMDDVKKGILCQLFGGTNKVFPNGRIRGEINVLLVGDPGVSKSQLLQYVHKIAPRGIYTSGKGSSVVGLTAYVTRDPDTRELVLESGALVLSDRGVCCIDEFDKMSDSTRSILHEVMEQQTVSVAKAGIICSLNARTSVLAAANPKESRYNDQLSIVENIQLPPTLLSRFDLIFLVRDKPDKDIDRSLAKHIIGLYYDQPQVKPVSIDTKTLTKYISYARRNIHPTITDEAREHLVHGYVMLRRLGSNRKQITATTRQLESLIRMSEALAKMRFSTKVEPEDVDEALRLVRVSIFKAAIDPKSGEIDIDLLTTGVSSKQRSETETPEDSGVSSGAVGSGRLRASEESLDMGEALD